MIKIITAILIISGFSINVANAKLDDGQQLKIATWNLQDFGGKLGGESKTSDTTILNAMAAVISEYDIIFVQEIANMSRGNCVGGNRVASFDNLCGAAYLGNKGYSCKNTQVITGDDFNCEAYGVIYKNNIALQEITASYTGDPTVTPYVEQGTSAGKIVRPPMKVFLKLKGGKEITIYNIHARYSTPPGSAPTLKLFDNLVKGTVGFTSDIENVIALGDFNADCVPFPRGFTSHPTIFPLERPPGNGKWYDIVPDEAITNMARGECAYDRIMINKSMYNSFNTENGGDYDIVFRVPRSNPINSYQVFNEVYVNNSKFQRDSYPDGAVKHGADGRELLNKTLSDHQLVWANFSFGGISAVDLNEQVSSTFLTTESVFFKGINFNKNKTYKVFVENQQCSSLADNHHLSTAAITPQITTNLHGAITKTLVKDPSPNNMSYCIVVDVNNDDRFQKNIDVTDDFIVTDTVVSTGNPSTTKTGTRASRGTKRVFSKVSPATASTGSVSKRSANGSIFTGTSKVKKSDNSVLIVEEGIVTEADGNFRTSPYRFGDLSAGYYNLYFDYPYGSVIDYVNQFGFIVLDPAIEYNDVVTLGDNGQEREIYNTEIAENIYTLAQNIVPTSGEEVDIYVVSTKKIKDNISNWDGKWSSFSGLELDSDVVVDNADCSFRRSKWFKDLVWMCTSTPYPITEFISGAGTLFTSIWENPGQAFAPPSDTEENSFTAYNGNEFNTVIDVNRDGRFTYGTDMVDTHRIDLITTWLTNNDSLDQNSPAAAIDAIKQYQKFLNGKLNLSSPLIVDGVYGSKTQEASRKFICSSSLDSSMLTTLQKSSQVGFKVMQPKEHYKNKTFADGSHHYSEANIDDPTMQGYSCISGEEKLSVNELTIEPNSTAVLKAPTVGLSSDSRIPENSQVIVEFGISKEQERINTIEEICGPSFILCAISPSVGIPYISAKFVLWSNSMF